MAEGNGEVVGASMSEELSGFFRELAASSLIALSLLQERVIRTRLATTLKSIHGCFIFKWLRLGN